MLPSGPLTPDLTNDSHCVMFTTNDDVILEDAEVFSFSVSSGDESVLEILPDNGQITIVDNDGKLI